MATLFLEKTRLMEFYLHGGMAVIEMHYNRSAVSSMTGMNTDSVVN